MVKHAPKETLGEFIAVQRRNAEMSLRQLADQSGVSNPYLSQIERGLRRPSAEVLQQLAKALRVSAESLYVRAGILHPADGESDSAALTHAVLADTAITERQKQVLLEVYQAFVQQNSVGQPNSTTGPDPTTEANSTTEPSPTTEQVTSQGDQQPKEES